MILRATETILPRELKNMEKEIPMKTTTRLERAKENLLWISVLSFFESMPRFFSF